jgi:holo-[acyl-carrier protein] synthase
VVLGIGIDIIDMAEFRDLCDEVFATYVFTERERVWAASRVDPVQALAGLFAAKEALTKAVSELEVPAGKDLRVFELTHTDDGAPHVCTDGECGAFLTAAGVTSAHVSISHSKFATVASAVLEG